MSKNDRASGGADVHAPRADETGGEVSPRLRGLRVECEANGPGTVLAAQFAEVLRHHPETDSSELREVWSLLVLLDCGELTWGDADHFAAVPPTVERLP